LPREKTRFKKSQNFNVSETQYSPSILSGVIILEERIHYANRRSEDLISHQLFTVNSQRRALKRS
jgi:hypothetical protein